MHHALNKFTVIHPIIAQLLISLAAFSASVANAVAAPESLDS